jgi:hypothetical protein
LEVAKAGMSDSKNHIIVLLQTVPDKTTRSFSDYESVDQAMDGVCQLFEARLKQLNPERRKITYDISDLFGYIDGLYDLACLVFDSELQAYVPHNKEWIKTEVFSHLKRQAASKSWIDSFSLPSSFLR